MSVIKNDPHPVVVTDPNGNTIDVVTSAATAGKTGLVVYPVPSSSVAPVQGASEGPTNTTVPADATLIGAKDGSGNLQALQVDSSTALKTSNLGVSTLNATGQVSVANTSTSIIGANAARAAVVIANPGSVAVYLGKTGVTISTGHWLGPSTAITIPTTDAIFGVVATGTQTVTYMELLP